MEPIAAVKTAGLLLSSAALLLVAFKTLSIQQRQLDTLRELCAALERMAAELGEHNTPLPELMDTLGREASPILRPFFTELQSSLRQLDERSFSESWHEAVDRHLLLTGTQKTVVYRLGGYLGRYAGEMQKDMLLSVQASLLRELKRQENAAPDRRRLTLGLTVSAISMLLILNL